MIALLKRLLSRLRSSERVGEAISTSHTESPVEVTQPPLESEVQVQEVRAQADVSVFVLGIDFGTSFTKVSYGDVGADEVRLVTFGESEAEKAMLPSVVHLSKNGDLSLSETPDSTPIRYLKMRLAGADFPGSSDEEIDLGGSEKLDAITAWFLANVISHARDWVSEEHAELIRGRTIQWRTHMGLPVEHHVSPHEERFKKVLSVAESWSSKGGIPSNLEDAVEVYRESASKIDMKIVDCDVKPEIAAAIYSFMDLPHSPDGLYLYFDVGGGTMDATCFKYLIWHKEQLEKREKQVAFFLGRVEPLGVESVAAGLNVSISELVSALAREGENSEKEIEIEKVASDVVSLVDEAIVYISVEIPHDLARTLDERGGSLGIFIG